MDTYVLSVATGKEKYTKHLLESIEELRPFYFRIWIPMRPQYRGFRVKKHHHSNHPLILDKTEQTEQAEQLTEQQTEPLNRQTESLTKRQFEITGKKPLFPSYLFIDTASYIDLITAFRTYQSYGFACQIETTLQERSNVQTLNPIPQRLLSVVLLH